MKKALFGSAVAVRRPWAVLWFAALCAAAGPAAAVGTAVGTTIENTATADFEISGTPQTLVSNTVTFAVAERIEVDVSVATPQLIVSAGDSDRSLLFTLTNTGNGSESFQLLINSLIAGDDFDPVPAVPAIYFDSDGSGDFSIGDTAYDPGVNDPLLAPDESISVLLVNDIPAGLAGGAIGRSELSAVSNTGTGTAGTVYANQGDGNTDAVIGISEGSDAATGEYLLEDILVNFVKTQAVADPNGGNQPITGATLTYTINVDVSGGGTATGSQIRDPIPPFTSFVPNSITLNGVQISDATDADAGEYDTTGTAMVVVRLGDLTQADGVQTVEFQVLID